jgi:hypothetical protein
LPEAAQDEGARQDGVVGQGVQGAPQEPLHVVEILLELDGVVDAVVAPGIEVFVPHARAVLEVQQARPLGQAVGHEGAGRDQGLHPAAIDHLAQQQALLGDRHRPRNRDDAKTIRVAHHRLQNVGGLSQAPATEGRLAHGADEGVHAIGLAGIEGGKRFQPVFVSGPE